MKTKDQIVRALILCATDHCEYHACPYYGEYNCHDLLMLSAADSIVRLIRDNRDLAGCLEKQKLNSIYGEVHHAEQTDQV